MVEEMGINRENVFLLPEGQTIWFSKGKAVKGEAIETKNIYVDAYGVGDIGNLVLRDRKTLATDGIVVAILALDNQMRLVSRPKILSKGFVFEKEEARLMEGAMKLIELILKPKLGRVFEINNIKREVSREVENFLFKQRGRRPLIITDVIQI